MAVIQRQETEKAEKYYEHTIIEEPKGERLRDSLKHALKNYFRQLKGEEPKEVYSMVLAEIELPLLEVLMQKTKNNQSLTTRILGLSRGTARQKLKKYGLLEKTPKKISK